MREGSKQPKSVQRAHCQRRIVNFIWKALDNPDYQGRRLTVFTGYLID